LSTTPNVPGPDEKYTYETSPTPRWIIVAFVILFLFAGFLFYAGRSARTELAAELRTANQKTQQLAAQLDQANTRLADLKGQLDVTSEKLGLTQQELSRARQLAQTIRQEQKASDEQILARLGQVHQESESKIGRITTEVSATKSDVESTKRDLEATKSKLERTIGDLGEQSGLIARNREEVEYLKRLGERNIYEFDLRKSNRPERLGPIQVTLRKVDTKRSKYTLDVIADDRRIEKKDKTVNEPVQFYTGGPRRALYEIVVFQLERDRAVGYLSTPKELATARTP